MKPGRPDRMEAYIALNSLTSIVVNNFYALMEAFGSADDVFGANMHALRAVDGVGPETARQIKECDPRKTADKERKAAGKNGVKIVAEFEEDFPKNLKTLHKPPPVIYIAGEITGEDRLAISIVGARKFSVYGRIIAEDFSATLAARGLTVVSGMARGIDTIAHKGALKAGARTIAVLGSGLDVCYPPENRELFDKIKNQGAVVSQFPFGTGPEKRNFPIRNRVICGLGFGVLVIEAGEKSGANITAYAALDEGREVFAVPGRIDSPKSAGTHRLIQRGAKLVTCADDVIDEFPPEVRALLERQESGREVELSNDEKKVMALLDSSERHVDYLIEKSGMPSGVVLGILLELELKGVVRQLPGKVFARAG
ncbi:MAG: DNA-processing protein DprA [Nitrospinota bacterium]